MNTDIKHKNYYITLMPLLIYRRFFLDWLNRTASFKLKWTEVKEINKQKNQSYWTGQLINNVAEN